MPGPTVTLSLMSVARSASINLPGSVDPARLNASSAISVASNECECDVLRLRSG
jgi:hypothetical protein